MDVNQKRREGPPGEGRDPQTTGGRNNPETSGRRNNRKEEEAPYKTEPDFAIEECHEKGNKFKVEHLGELPCPVPPEVE